MITPNAITITRIFSTPLFIAFFIVDQAWSMFVCLIILGLFELTDALDGHLARSKNMVSDFGKLMDPYADSIARFTVFLCFLAADYAPVYIIAIFFYRDVLVSIIRVFAIREGVVVSARTSGKIKAWFQALASFGVVGIVLAQKLGWLPQELNGPLGIPWITIIIAIAALYTLWSGIDYWNGNKEMVIKSMSINTK